LNEALFGLDERQTPTGHARISATQGKPAALDLDERVEILADTAARNDVAEVRLRLTDLVPGYCPPAVAVGACTSAFDAIYPDDF
jgi:hypothetical protein